MHMLWFVVVAVVVSQSNAALSPFLECQGNEPRWYNLLVRRCCYSVELPNSCECFSIENDSGYRNSLRARPRCPHDIEVSFLLYTKNNKDTHTILKAGSNGLSGVGDFQTGKPVKFIIHGFRDRAPKPWSTEMKDVILAEDPDVNVIVVNWQEGAKVTTIVYGSAVANARTVGAMIAKLLINLKNGNYLASYDDVHLIGHSLGSHVSGTAGKEVKRLTGHTIGRISGLDPAGPLYENYGDRVRLGKDDAKFVDVIHTNGVTLGFGIRINVGHVDFWPNGGKFQPGCDHSTDSSSFGFAELVGVCDHVEVTRYYTDSIKACSNVVDDVSGCRMGYHANSEQCQGVYNDDHGNFKMDTTRPYCVI